MDEERPWRTADAAAFIGVSKSTVIRRAKLYAAGDRTPDALKSGRTRGTTGDRFYDPWDCERVRRQLRGLLPPYVTPDMWAQIPRDGVWREPSDAA